MGAMDQVLTGAAMWLGVVMSLIPLVADILVIVVCVCWLKDRKSR